MDGYRVGPSGADGNSMYEDSPMLVVDGKKRPRSESNASPISLPEDSNEVSGELDNPSHTMRFQDVYAKCDYSRF